MFIEDLLCEHELEIRNCLRHTCPGDDCDATHSSDVDYAELLPTLFELNAGNFYMELAREPDLLRVLKIVKDHLKPWQRVFVGVIDPLDPRVEPPKKSVIGFLRPLNISRLLNWVRRMIVDFLPSAMTPRLFGTRHLRKSGHE